MQRTEKDKNPSPEYANQEDKYNNENINNDDDDDDEDDDDEDDEDDDISKKIQEAKEKVEESKSGSQKNMTDETGLSEFSPESDTGEMIDTKHAQSHGDVQQAQYECDKVNGKSINYFSDQLKQVNTIITNILGEITEKHDRNRCYPCSCSELNYKHQHRNLQDKKKGGICSIVRRSRCRKKQENCLLCQLLSLQERVDSILNREFDGDSECVRKLKEEQSRLRKQVGDLISNYEQPVAEDTGFRNSKFDSACSRRASKQKSLSGDALNKYDNREARGSRECKAIQSQTDRNKINTLQESVFLSCLNELVVLIKSMNCVASPGTFWQRRLTEVEKKKLQRCCARDYPHMHGELNGVSVIIRLRPSKHKQEKDEAKQQGEEGKDDDYTGRGLGYDESLLVQPLDPMWPPEQVEEKTKDEESESSSCTDSDSEESNETKPEKQMSDDLEYAIKKDQKKNEKESPMESKSDHRKPKRDSYVRTKHTKKDQLAKDGDNDVTDSFNNSEHPNKSPTEKEQEARGK